MITCINTTYVEKGFKHEQNRTRSSHIITCKTRGLPFDEKELQEAFTAGIIDAFGDAEGGPIPPDESIDESFIRLRTLSIIFY